MVFPLFEHFIGKTSLKDFGINFKYQNTLTINEILTPDGCATSVQTANTPVLKSLYSL